MTNPKPGWTQRRFITWLVKNYPDPGTRYCEVSVALHHGVSGTIFYFTMAHDFAHCIVELAWELAINGVHPEDQWNILIRPAPRRKTKQMWLQPNDPAVVADIARENAKPRKVRIAELEAKGLRLHACPKCGAKGYWAVPPVIIICDKCKKTMVPLPPKTL